MLDDLIGRIYESALDPSLWDDTLMRITTALGPLEWDLAFLIWERSQPPGARFVGSTGLADWVPPIYSSIYAASNPWSQRIAPLRSGTVVDTYELMSRDDFTASPLYSDFLSRWGLDRALAVMLDRRGSERLALVLPGPGGRDLDLLKRGLRVLAPHIQRAVRISHRIADAELTAAAAGAAADRSASAVLCLTTDLGVVSANRQVSRLEEAGVITLAGGRLAFRELAAQRELVRLSRADPPAGAAFIAANADGGSLAVVGARVPTQTARALGGAVAGAGLIVSIGGGGEPRAIEISRIAAWFGLTPAEARLASAMSGGMTLADYCGLRNVSVNAGRFLLKGVFRKMQVTSQAAMVALVARLPAEV